MYSGGDFVFLRPGNVWTNETFKPKGNGNLAANSWITLTSGGSDPTCGYRKNARPLIQPGATIDAAIQFDNASFTGGWKIKGVDIDTAKIVGVDAEVTTGIPASGLWLEDMNITNITGAQVSSPILGAYPNPGFNAQMGTGILFFWVDDTTVKNVTVAYTDTAFLTLASSNGLWDGFLSDHTYRANAGFQYTGTEGGVNVYRVGPGTFRNFNNVTVQNSKFLYSGWRDGMYWGTSAIEMLGGIDVTLQDCEMAYTTNPIGNIDAVGIDLEGANQNTTILRCYVHDNDGAALLMNQSAGGVDTPPLSLSGSVITDNRLINNGLILPASTPAVLRANATTHDAVQILRNTITRAVPGVQKLFSAVHGSATDTPQVTWSFPLSGPDANIITN